MPKIRLDKFLADSGIGTRSQVKKLIRSKRVRLNGEITDNEGFKVEENEGGITLDNKPVILEKFIYLMLNKPSGVVSATTDRESKTVIDLLPQEYKIRGDLFPVGRLDKDTEGLVILTNNGAFAHKTLSPKKHISKTYFVRVENFIFNEEKVKRFADGIVLADGYKCLPAKLELVNATADYTEVTLTISEGKFHQVKRMFGAVDDGKVTYLKRISFGEIMLDKSLKPGEYRPLNSDEMLFVAKQEGI